MNTSTHPTAEAAPFTGSSRRVPYLPGLDGLRALAIVAVLVYHANPAWLPGGFIGVEMFFVISGYLITLLLDEHQRTGTVNLRTFYARRARRLLPALFTMLVMVTGYTALFRRDALGQLRGQVVGAFAYVSNWYQIWIGEGYTSSGDFAPLRHLWSLAVEEQFYLVWPLVMVGLLRLGRRPSTIGLWLLGGSLTIAAGVAALFHGGPTGTCETTPAGYWHVAGHCVSKMDVLYLSTPARAGGLLLGAALATVWRPWDANPLLGRRRVADVVGVAGLAALAFLAWTLYVETPDGADPWLFRGGLLTVGVATVAMIAAATTSTSALGGLLGRRLPVWIGLRSYGLYLFHWPIYQAIRRVAGNTLSMSQFVLALALTLAVTELSYRLIEAPIRHGALRRMWSSSSNGRRQLPTIAATAALTLTVAGCATQLAVAPNRPNEIAAAQQSAEQYTGDPLAFSSPTAGTISAETPSTTAAVASAPVTTMPKPDRIEPVVTPVPATAPPTTAPVTVSPTTVPPAPETTAPPAPETTLPPVVVGDPCAASPITRYAVGDSVMLGAAQNLADAGFCVDAAVSRQFSKGLDQVIQLNAAGRLGDVVVVHLGTNGSIGQSDLDRMMTELANVPRVVIVTDKADRSWIGGNDDMLRALPATYPNVVVVDWATASADCPGDCFYDDGIHLPPDGRAYFTQLILAAIA